MNVRFATDKERNNWDALLSRNPDGGNIFQSKELTEFKQRSGWTPRFLIIENFDKNKSLAIAIQEKRIFGLGTLWYAFLQAVMASLQSRWKVKSLSRRRLSQR